MQHEMTGRKHEAHVRKDTVACIKKPRITDKCQSLQYHHSPHREDENQKIRGSQRMDCEGGGERHGEKVHDWTVTMNILCTKIWVD